MACAGGYGTCAPETDLHAHVTVDTSGGFDYYDETDDQPTVDARVFAYRDTSGHTWLFATTDQAVLMMAPQAAAEKAFKRVEEMFAKYPIG